MIRVDMKEVWRDKNALEDISSEILRQKIAGWSPWQILLPPDLLWPMLEEVSTSMFQEWSPFLFGVGIHVGQQGELSIKFVRTDEKKSPVMVQTKPYVPMKKDNIIPVEVGYGNKIRV